MITAREASAKTQERIAELTPIYYMYLNYIKDEIQSAINNGNFSIVLTTQIFNYDCKRMLNRIKEILEEEGFSVCVEDHVDNLEFSINWR